MTIRWSADTCKCVIEFTTHPRVDGVFIKRCGLHPTGTPGETYDHSIQSKFRELTLDSMIIRKAMRKQERDEPLTPPEQAEINKRDIIQKRKRTEYLRS